jgi:YVTN family beta-propeller protein
MKFTPTLSKLVLAPVVRVVFFAILATALGAGVALAQTRAYVTNNDDHTVTVIDTATASVIATIPVAAGPAGVAVTPNGRFVYVVNQQANSVSVISAATNTVVATIPVGSFQREIAITPDGAFAYVSGGAGSNIVVIDTATNTVVTTIPVSSPFMIALAPSGNLGYVTHGAIVNGVTVINTTTNSVVTNIPIPVDVAGAVTVTPNGAFVYVACLSFTTGSKLAVIDTATNTVVAFVPLPGTFAPGLAITPNGAFAYVANNGGGVCCGGGGGVSSMSVIDTATNTEIARFGVGPSPSGVAVTPDGAFVYVTDLSNKTVSVISTANDSVVALVPVELSPRASLSEHSCQSPPRSIHSSRSLTSSKR